MTKKLSNRLTIDDLLNSGSENFKISQGKNGRVRIKKKPLKIPFEMQYHMFFRLIKDNPSIPEPVTEFKFHPIRKWRVDICWPDQKLALEVEGGIWVKGRHIHPSGFLNDLEKYNQLSILGYSLLRATPQQMDTCEAYDFVRDWFKNNG